MLVLLISTVGLVVSTICVALAVASWILLTKWRTLLNYIMINHITVSTLNLWIIHAEISTPRADGLYIYVLATLSLLGLCWSCCAALFTYLKLVLLFNGQIPHEKTKVTLIVIYLVTTIECIAYAVEMIQQVNFFNLLLLMCVIIMTFNVALLIKTVLSIMSCCRKSMSPRTYRHSLALIGVAFACDFITVIVVSLLFIVPRCLDIPFVLYHYKPVVETCFLMFKKQTRDNWKMYIARRKRVRNFII